MEAMDIKKIIEDYSNLKEFTEQKIEQIEKLNPKKYCTSRGVTDFDFYDNVVSVHCDDSSMGCWNSLHFVFPISFLSMDDETLEKEVLAEKEKDEGIERKNIEDREKKERENKLAKYEQLRKELEL